MPEPQPVEGGYAPRQDVPLGTYAVLAGLFDDATTYVMSRRRDGPPANRRMGTGDLALGSPPRPAKRRASSPWLDDVRKRLGGYIGWPQRIHAAGVDAR